MDAYMHSALRRRVAADVHVQSDEQNEDTRQMQDAGRRCGSKRASLSAVGALFACV